MIRILIADDHQMFRQGLRALLADDEAYQITGEAENGAQVLELLKADPVDVVLMDINMPELDGIEATRQIVAAFPAVRVLMLTMYNRASYIKEILEVGAKGYILKSTGKDELKLAIDTVMSGEDYLADAVKDTLVDSFKVSSMQGEVRLTPREKDILTLICEERTTAEIADQLFISVNTVESHRRNLMSKTGARNAIGLVKAAYEMDLVKRSSDRED